MFANVVKMSSEMDEELFSACLTKCKEYNGNQTSLDEKREVYVGETKLESAAALQPLNQ